MEENEFPNQDALDEIERRRALTTAYSRYSRNAAGLSSVIGGGLCLVAFMLNALVPLPLYARLLLASTPLIWILAKEFLRHRFYQQFGVVEEVWTAGEQRAHLGRNGFVAAVSVLVVGAVLWRSHFAPPLPMVGYLVFVIAMPFLSWHYLRSKEEFKVGIFLICQAAVVLGGGHYGYVFLAIAVVFSITAIVVGLHQHRDFRRIARELSSLEPIS